MSVLLARKVTLSFGPRTVLSAVDLDVSPGDRVGLSAPNGVGKSTLLRVLAGELPPEEGTVTLRPGAVLAHLTQETDPRPGESLGPLDLTIGGGERWPITGPNGSGKSTLIGALLGRIPLLAGERSVGASVVVGEVDQLRHTFDTEDSALAVVMAATGLHAEPARTLLAKFRLGADAVPRPARELSPGERTRAGLAVLQARGTTCLVLDEPTNHLELPAIEQLEQALADYPGTLILITHDRRLAQAVRVDHVLDVTAESGRPRLAPAPDLDK
ncbi:ATP-binding cassette domain-containing protein [Crossiella sp. SN42]|uniref:ATP-binding cassette domain-containing protein n=1 Tax=Crossiella sp. SN42 TaxID=2944808 RepID=UPI0027DED437|nr:ATP-binding cassette domain-containing protein [Crossiella sp. SN42]